MKTNRRHANDTATFDELDFMGQNRSINAQIAVLKKAVGAHIRRAAEMGKDASAIRSKRVTQIRRLADQIEG